MQKMKIGTLCFGGGEQTFGLQVIKEEISNKTDIEIIVCNYKNIKEVDILLLSLYWWENIYEWVRFLIEAGINPESKRPFIIAGGMACLNPKPIISFVNAIVLGDGESVILELIDKIINKKNIDNIKGVVTQDNINNSNEILIVDKLRPYQYVEKRTSATTRIEIARGCKFKCPFCLISFIKPYKELNHSIVKALIKCSETRNVALFAPERSGHTNYDDILNYIQSYRKRDTGTDLRLDTYFNKKRPTYYYNYVYDL